MAATGTTKYAKQRKKVTPPHVGLQALRTAVGITIDDLIERILDITGVEYTRGAISAVENGIRGASIDLIEGIAAAYGIDPSTIDTAYVPRRPRVRAA